MVDLDVHNQYVSTPPLSDEDTYAVTEEFLLNNLFLFALRKAYVRAAEAVLPLFYQSSCRAPALALWCLLAMKAPTPISPNSSSRCDGLESLITIANDLHASLDQSSDDPNPFARPLMNYLTKARRLVIHVHLESFVQSGDHAVFLRELNRHLPATDPDPSVRGYRFKFSRLIMSQERAKLYLQERWLPHREDALRSLNDLARDVARQFPTVFFDKIGTPEWKAVDAILLHLNTAMSVYARTFSRL